VKDRVGEAEATAFEELGDVIISVRLSTSAVNKGAYTGEERKKENLRERVEGPNSLLWEVPVDAMLGEGTLGRQRLEIRNKIAVTARVDKTPRAKARQGLGS
jgi:hypothetical protein